MMELDKIYCGDNVEVLSGFPDECIDLTVTSPPYDNLRDYNGYTFDFEKLAAELYRVTKTGGVVVWVVGDAVVDGSETGTSFRQALGFMGQGWKLHDTMIYKKSCPHPPNVRYWQEFEYMLVFSKDAPKTFNPLMQPKQPSSSIRQKYARNVFTRGKDGQLRSLSQAGHARMKKAAGNNNRVRSNVWEFAVGGGCIGDALAHKHPAVFPEALARDHILSWSNPDDTVLDPFVGSGTTPKMCVEADRHYIGIDISEECCELARRRVANAQPPLFVI